MTTRPLSGAEIEEVFGDGAPGGEPGGEPGSAALSGVLAREPAPGMLAEWRRVWDFVKWPRLPHSAGMRAPLIVVARVFALDIALMALLVSAAFVAVALGYDIAPTALSEMEITWLIAAGVIIAAPVMEEIVFRSWLSGRPGHVLAWLCLMAGALAFTLVGHTGAVMPLLIMGPALLGAVAALVLLRGRLAMRWFAAIFPLFFWLSTFAFALVHLANFDDASILTLLPLVLPQFLLGGLLAYLRVHVGLWAAILLHAVHNAVALGLAVLTMEVATSAG